jgi:hypothetical protein
MENGDREFFKSNFKELKDKIEDVSLRSDKKDEDLKDAIHKINIQMPKSFPCTSNKETENPLIQISNIRNTVKTLIAVLSISSVLLAVILSTLRILKII